MKPQAIWASVAIVFILVASATTLVILDKDVSILLTLVALVALPVLGGLGATMVQKLNQVKESSDGNLHRLLNLHQQSTNQLTNLALSMTPPPVVAVPETVAEQEGSAEGGR